MVGFASPKKPRITLREGTGIFASLLLWIKRKEDEHLTL